MPSAPHTRRLAALAAMLVGLAVDRAGTQSVPPPASAGATPAVQLLAREGPLLQITAVRFPRFDGPTTFEGEMVLTNVGTAPAVVVRPTVVTYIAAPLAPAPPTDVRVLAPGAAVRPPNQPTTLAPAAAVTLRVQTTISAPQFADLANGGVVLKVRGVIRYADPSGASRTTELCYLSRPGSPSPTFTMGLCDYGNSVR